MTKPPSNREKSDIADVLRRRLRLPDTQHGPVTVRLVQSKEELRAALSLLHDVYVSESYMAPTRSGMRFSAYNALSTTATAVAIAEGRVIGTITAIQDSALGLPIDKILDISKLRQGGKRLSEISGLAIHPDYRGYHGDVMYRMVKFIVNYCEPLHGDDIVVISVNPKHRSLYRDIILFDSINETPVDCESVQGAPAIGMFADLRGYKTRLSKTYGSAPLSRNLESYFYAEDKTVTLPQKETFHTFDTIMTPANLAYFLDLTAGDESISGAESQLIRSQLSLPGYQEVFGRLQIGTGAWLKARRSQRFPFRSRAFLVERNGGGIRPLRVDNIGRNGIGGWTSSPIDSSTVDVEIPITPTTILGLTVEPVFSDGGGRFGFRVVTCSDGWLTLNDTLEGLLGHERRPEPSKDRWPSSQGMRVS